MVPTKGDIVAKYNNFMFSVPNLPRPVYDNVRAIAEKLGLSHQEIVILGVAAIMALSRIDKPALDSLVDKVSGVPTMDMSSFD